MQTKYPPIQPTHQQNQKQSKCDLKININSSLFPTTDEMLPAALNP